MSYEDRDPHGMYRSDSITGAGPDTRRGPGPELMGAATLIGNEVHNHNDENLGEVKEIMLDMHSGRISYAVLSFGGFLGMGKKLFAVPWGALRLDTESKNFILNVEKGRLAHAPGFDKGRWPNMADPSWQQEINDYYQSGPSFGDRHIW
ncbi:PRC-barrel domain-containing protein [Neisseriaceae bacterium JH1-16]|nr:PRC-barrel domain-containing protein [Neisseriaceae bacterium JH1-16]